ncbi:MAG: glycosyltransferase 87 family protein [Gaiellaceae bacterium]
MVARLASSTLSAERRSWVAAALAGSAIFVVAWSLLHVWHWGGYQIIDTPVYQRYGDAVVAGQVPYRDFGLEYPPGALPAFVVPALFPSGAYRGAFEALMLACGLAMVVLVARAAAALGATGIRLYAPPVLVGAAPLALGTVVLTRFDLWPAALTAAALTALLTGRDRVGAGLLGLATAAKFYPAVLLPLALVWTLRRHGRRGAFVAFGVFAAVALAVVLPFAVLAPHGVASSLARHAGRPLQIESLGAALLLAGNLLELYDPRVVFSDGSQNLDGRLAETLAAAQTALQGLALVVVWILFARSRPTGTALVAASASAVTAFVAFGKVLSPQFLIWLIPLVPLIAVGSGIAAPALFATSLVLTQLWFPSRYWDVVRLEPVGWLVLLRDLVLVALLAVLLRALARARATARTA